MKVAVIHYWFVTRRGGEKVVESILSLFPGADVYTLFYDKEGYGDHLKNHKVYTSVLDKPFLRKRYQKIFPLYPIGIKSLKLKDDYDLIISSESGPAKGISNKNNIPHLCYIHSPMRYCWGFSEEYLQSVKPMLRPVLAFFFNRLKQWDKTTIKGVDLYVANSENVAKRVMHFYNRDAKIVYPPIADNLFEKPLMINKERDVYLSFGAITPYKKIDLLVDAFNLNGKKLIVIGRGSEMDKYKSKAKSNIEFMGELPWDEIEAVFARSKALLFPGEEDFGMIPLEVMSYGIPVIAYKKGGALETVVENLDNIEESSGMFFDRQEVNSLQESINCFEKVESNFDPVWIRNHAKNFSENIFLKKISLEIELFMKHKI
ncbi:Glycosyltransferase involved in cell wall bisynthesis [Algibacter lectus]|uniref:glycosyltransferase n=1 Tax=Algibacter lectus TaxID=221126 RepID=UPI0008EDF375|nr:glycosyltransferase [Algibacter lectus]SFC63995.1 Glycosyltransferase involved in cell wall bisynthesis [Algibacter lectus]